MPIADKSLGLQMEDLLTLVLPERQNELSGIANTEALTHPCAKSKYVQATIKSQAESVSTGYRDPAAQLQTRAASCSVLQYPDSWDTSVSTVRLRLS